ncbi:unnamed protein product, partial [Brassica oleracea var. botrytis]
VWSEAVSLSLCFIACVVLLLGSVFVVVRSLLWCHFIVYFPLLLVYCNDCQN